MELSKLLVFQRIWRYIKNSIAFIPALYVLGFIGFAVLMRYLESIGLSNWLGKQGEFWLISSAETARTILSTIIGGVISLTVFSFSMVMVVLSQATSTLSPRLLPQLIRDRSHQRVLGINLGVIVFAFLSLIAINPREEWNMNSFTIFIAVIMAIACLGFFVYFISSISQRIQVGDVMLRVGRNARRDIEYWKNAAEEYQVKEQPDSSGWQVIEAGHSGYIDLALYGELSRLAKKYDTAIHLVAYRSAYVLEASPIIRIERKLSAADLAELRKEIKLSKDDNFHLWYFSAIRHITEVAVKAMSPGINDPGTALEAIDMISDLVSGLIDVPFFNHFQVKNEGGSVYFESMGLPEILRLVMQELRCYSKADPVVMQRLAIALFKLRRRADTNSELYEAITQEIAALEEDGLNNLTNSYDQKSFKELIQHLSESSLDDA